MVLTKDWQDYDGDYQKKIQDIMLANGDILLHCWPNAGKWSVLQSRGNKPEYLEKDIPHKMATKVRLTHVFY